LPPIAKLSSQEAMQQFLAGYTAKLAGTERGIKTPEATFSACFGAPFLPRHPQVYADLLNELMAKHNTRCFLLNTGWTGGAYGVGKRISLSITRALLQAVISGALDSVAMRVDENFGFSVPRHVEGLDDRLLNPRQSWSDGAAYDVAAKNLVALFAKTNARFSVSKPTTRQAAE
jgi:phosphoenolpyruvate carboxykinase (ATP)